MSGGNVCVLALNGRRQTVKCTPNTTILQILEEVCKKQNLKSEDFDLKHHNKILDTSAIFRFSGLPNNAQLELVAVTKARIESDVTLAVNIENGSRLMGNFSPNENLLTILTKIHPECLEEGKSPVVIYTRREIYGQELTSVTLKSLGLTGGRAMIRIINKNPEELKQQANVAAPLPSKPTEEKPYIRKFQPLEDSQPVEQPTAVDKADSESESDTQKVEKIQKKQNVDLIKLAKEKRKNNETSTPQMKEKKIIPEKQKKISKFAQHQNCCCTKKVMDCSEKCKGKCSKKLDEIEDDFVFLGKRNAMLFSQESALSVPNEELPDNFFDLTIDDARKLLRDVRKQRHNLENGQLLTSTLRNLEESKKQLRNLNVYKKAIIRIQFPDRVVLQGTFAPSDTIKDVIEFIRDYLDNKSLRFYVYSTPPKCILEETKRLIELGFVPGAVVHFGTDQPDVKYVLRRDLQDKFTSNSIASLAAAKIRRENMRKCDSDYKEDFDEDLYDTPNPTPMVVDDGASTSTGITHERKILTPTENVPKWFKPL